MKQKDNSVIIILNAPSCSPVLYRKMLPKNIRSLQHPFVKYLVKLRKERFFRRQEQKILILGRIVIQELLDIKDTPVKIVLVKEGFCFSCSLPVINVSHEILQKITGTQSPEPVAALVQFPSFVDIVSKNHKSPYLLILDGIADPGNLGTLLRSALAFGWSGVYLTENSCDPFNEKALRAAKGATFRLPLQEGSWTDLISELSKQESRPVFLADLQGIPLAEIAPKPPLALVLSKESQGVRNDIPSFFSRVTLPMSGHMESLNVAAAGAILLYELRGRLL